MGITEHTYTDEPQPYTVCHPYLYRDRIVWIPDWWADQTGVVLPPRIIKYNGYTVWCEA